MMALIEGLQRQQAGVTRDLSTRKIGSNGSMLDRRKMCSSIF
jgi:hypothetical protein